MTPLEYVERADRELAFGRLRQAAALMWKATEATFTALAQARGLEDCGDLAAVARALDDAGRARGRYYRSNLFANELLRDHVDLEVLEDCEVEFSYATARQFVLESCRDAG